MAPRYGKIASDGTGKAPEVKYRARLGLNDIFAERSRGPKGASGRAYPGEQPPVRENGFEYFD
jgi:hypothetical protein